MNTVKFGRKCKLSPLVQSVTDTVCHITRALSVTHRQGAVIHGIKITLGYILQVYSKCIKEFVEKSD